MQIPVSGQGASEGSQGRRGEITLEGFASELNVAESSEALRDLFAFYKQASCCGCVCSSAVSGLLVMNRVNFSMVKTDVALLVPVQKQEEHLSDEIHYLSGRGVQI